MPREGRARAPDGAGGREEIGLDRQELAVCQRLHETLRELRQENIRAEDVDRLHGVDAHSTLSSRCFTNTFVRRQLSVRSFARDRRERLLECRERWQEPP